MPFSFLNQACQYIHKCSKMIQNNRSNQKSHQNRKCLAFFSRFGLKWKQAQTEEDFCLNITKQLQVMSAKRTAYGYTLYNKLRNRSRAEFAESWSVFVRQVRFEKNRGVSMQKPSSVLHTSIQLALPLRPQSIMSFRSILRSESVKFRCLQIPLNAKH